MDAMVNIMPRKGTPMNDQMKNHLSNIMKAKRRKAEKYAKYLGLPINEVMHNLPYLEKTFTFKQIRRLSQYIAQKILSEGNWKEQYSIVNMIQVNHEQQNDYVKNCIKRENIIQGPVKEIDRENYQRDKALNCGYEYNEPGLMQPFEKEKINVCKESINDPAQDLKVAFWFINKIGGIEKAKKIFAAATLAIEAMQS